MANSTKRGGKKGGAKAPALRGRPSKYTKEIGDEICDLIAQGYSLRRVRETLPSCPDLKTVFAWFRTQPEFLQQYTRAKEDAADLLVDQMLHLADTVDDMNPNAVNKARLQVDTRKWIAMKLKPKKYGDRVDLTTDGKEMPAPILNIFAKIGQNDTTKEIDKPIIEGEVSENAGDIQKGNIMDDING